MSIANANASALSVFAPEIAGDDARAIAAAGERAGAAGERAVKRRASASSAWRAIASMTQAYALLIIVVIGVNALARAFQPRALDLSPEGMALVGGVDPSVVARSNASAFAMRQRNERRSNGGGSVMKHRARMAIRGTFNGAAWATVGTARGAAALGNGAVALAVSVLERVGCGFVVDIVSMVANAASSSVSNAVWLVGFAAAPAVDYGLAPLYEFVYDGLEPLYLTFVVGTMEKFEDMTFALEQNLAAVLDERVLSRIRYPLHVVLNPFKWPMGVYETIIYPAYNFAAYPELYDYLPEPVPPVVKRTFGDRCRASAWGEWTACSVECGDGFKVRVNHCGKREWARCWGNGIIGCDGKCNSGRSSDCNGICGGKAVIDKCGTCGGMNFGLGCDGKCFSGKREDLAGNCCDGSAISSSGMCSVEADVPSHLKAATTANGKVRASVVPKKKPSWIRRIFNVCKFTILLVLRILILVVRFIILTIVTTLRTFVFVFFLVFSGAMLKLLGTMTLGFVVLGVVDKKAQENVAAALKSTVPFISADKVAETSDRAKSSAKSESENETHTYKERAETAVKQLITLLKRADEAPGTAKHYAMWLYRRTQVRFQTLVPLILSYLSDSTAPKAEDVIKAREESENARLRAEQLAAEVARLKKRVKITETSEAEKAQALAAATKAQEDAESEKLRAIKDAEKAHKDAEKALVELERVKAEALKSQASVAKEFDSIRAAEQARAEAEQARVVAEQARMEAERTLKTVRQEADRIREHAEKQYMLAVAETSDAKSQVALLEKEAADAREKVLREFKVAEANLQEAHAKVQEFEAANLKNADVLVKDPSAMQHMREYAEKLVAFFTKRNADALAAAKVNEVSEYVAHAKKGDYAAVIETRVNAGGALPTDVVQRFTSLRKYRARRNSVIVLVKLSRNHPDDATRRRCYEALIKLANSSASSVQVLLRCEAMSNAMLDVLEWSCGTADENGAPYEAMEFSHAMVSSKHVVRNQVLRSQISDPVHARCVLAILKTVPHNHSIQGIGLGTLWQLIRISGYGAEMQSALLADGLIRHIVDTCVPANDNIELARVVCGCALALATQNESVQKTMTLVQMPQLLVAILSKHSSIDYRGEFTKLGPWLTAK